MKAIMRDEREMKDSGIEWIGEIPTTWIPTKMKSIFRNISEKNHPNAEVLSLYREYGIVPKNSRDDNHNVTSLDTASYKYVRKGNLVINKMKAWQGSLAVSDYDGIISPAYYVCEFKNQSVDKKYIHYILRSNIYAQEFERLSTGMRIGQWDLGIDDFMNVPILIPIHNEQEAIANYLDDRCSKIDTIIDEAKASIEEYKELKQAVIYEAVTKGLDKNVEMKDSGIDWIGEIPIGWEIVPLRSFFESEFDAIVDGPFGSDMKNEEYVDEGVPIVQLGNIQNGSHSIDKVHYITEEKADILKRHNAAANDLVVAKMMPAGKACILSNIYERYVVSADVARIHIASINDKKYLVYALNCYGIMECAQCANGSTRARVNVSKIKKIKIASPNSKERKLIVSYLDNRCSQIDNIIATKQSLIEDLESYKKSLIYEVVTGKRKVVE